MDYNVEFKITLPEELLETFGIDEDTPFEAYFEDGAIKVKILNEDELEMYGYEVDEDELDDEDCDIDECLGCPYYCQKCGACTCDD